ncbi:MAG: hypothetical protein IJ261_03155, partial [Clostridia bacterium]|nr:hypothetical protein [Clostridia bacterium]
MNEFSMMIVKKFTAFVLALLNIFGCLFGTDKIVEKQVPVNGSLSCTDELGRNVVSAGESEKLV